MRTIRKDLTAEYKITADRHIANRETCLSRMEKGVDLLEQNETVRIAFQYMNLAMLMQQLHYNLPLQRWLRISQKKIAEKTDISLRTIATIMGNFRDKGIIDYNSILVPKGFFGLL